MKGMIIINIDAVFEGGGVKAIAFVGAISHLEEKGYIFKKVAGTSAGSIVASLLAAGYTGKELKDILANLDYSKFLSKNGIESIPYIGKYIGLIKEKGMYDGNYIEQWIEGLLAVKGIKTFKDIMIKGKSPLKIITADINKQELVILPDDLIKYNIDPGSFPIAKAVRMSISIPFFFKPVKIQYQDKTKVNQLGYFIDGGTLSNFPVWIFDIEGIPRWPTFGFKLGSDNTYNGIIDKTPLKNYLSCIVETMIDKNEEVFLRDKDSVRTICIPTLDVSVTDFHISKEKSLALYESGYNSAAAFLKTWNFYDYIKKHRNHRKHK